MKNTADFNIFSKDKRKKQLPFRLGCTSYVYPDDILPNVRKMANVIDDMEIVLFHSDKLSNFPDKKVFMELKELAEKYNITYTIHFPSDLKAGSKNKQEREDFADNIRKVTELTSILNPYAYVLHLEGIEKKSNENDKMIWENNITEVCENIAKDNAIDSKKIAVENLSYPIEWHINIAEKFNFSLCLDVGHLWVNDYDWENIVEKYINKVRVIHLHGVNEGKDHLSLHKMSKSTIQKFLNMIEGKFQHVLTLEVFGIEDTFQSLKVMSRI